MCLPIMKSIIFHTLWTLHSRKRHLRTWLCFSWCSFFAFWWAEKQLFHIAPFLSASYVLNNLKCFEICNVVSNLNKRKTLILYGQYLKNAKWKKRKSYTYLCFRSHSEYQFHILVLWISSTSDLIWRRNPHFRRVNNSNMPNGNTGQHIKIYFSEFSLFLSFI